MTPQENKLIKLAEKVANGQLGDSQLFLLDEIHAVEDKVDTLSTTTEGQVKDLEAKIEDIKQSAPDLNKVLESVRGTQGIQGEKGEIGDTGAQGESIKGDKGDKGDTGERGLRGLVGSMGATGEPGSDGINGIDGKNGKNGSPDTSEQIRDKLETLKEDDRLDVSAIKGIDKIENKIKAIQIRPVGKAGRSLLQLYVDGTKRGAIQYLNLIPGTGVALTYSSKYGRNDITISATGAGAFSILVATGAVDDSNTIFTFVSAPSIVVVNGASYVNGAGVTIAGTTATLDNPVGTGGNIYAIG